MKFDFRGAQIGRQFFSGDVDVTFDQRGQTVGSQVNVGEKFRLETKQKSRQLFEKWWRQKVRPADPKEAAWEAWWCHD